MIIEQILMDAPEGATGYIPETADDHGAYVNEDYSRMFIAKRGEWEDSDLDDDDNDKVMQLFKSEIKEEVKPVYTQAMCDAGELPPVGVGCMIMVKNDWFKCIVDYVGTGVLCYTNMDGEQHGVRVKTGQVHRAIFKPLDTRTDEEKLIDEKKMINDLINSPDCRFDTLEKLAKTLKNMECK